MDRTASLSTAQPARHAQYGNTVQDSYYIAGPLAPGIIELQLWGPWPWPLGRFDRCRQHRKKADITGRVTIAPNENNDIIFEAGHARLRRYSTAGNNNKNSEANTYNVNNRDH